MFNRNVLIMRTGNNDRSPSAPDPKAPAARLAALRERSLRASGRRGSTAFQE